MTTDKKLKRCKFLFVLRQMAYLALVVFLWVRLLSMGYIDAGLVFALITVTFLGLLVSQYDVLWYLKQVDDCCKDGRSK